MLPHPVSAPSRPRDRSSTEAAILDAGERILLRDGFTGLNIQTLAAEAGCDRKLVYRYFGGMDEVVLRLGSRAAADLVRSLDATPPSADGSLRAFVRTSLGAWLTALQASPLTLRLMTWADSERSDPLLRIEAERTALLQAWMRERRPRLRTPPQGDVTALTAVLLAAVQQLVLTADRKGAIGGFPLDAQGWRRIGEALDQLTEVFPG
jgi:AcrR family transcriptional regulator